MYVNKYILLLLTLEELGDKDKNEYMTHSQMLGKVGHNFQNSALSLNQRYFISKHLKGQLVPSVSDVTFFGPKEVSWSPLSVT